MTIFELFGFFAQTMGAIFTAFDSVYIGDHSILDISVSLMYLSITMWGIFTLLSHKKDVASVGDDK